ncbi:TPA: hypothetical protein DEG21_03500 [Patescibacteria group bacterium]|nr:hypothetical protein [Candidatus Gracilibacteria bacterium]HBY74920.1 hypothetical protein [Candidatus Gracilibacteria bacterium]
MIQFWFGIEKKFRATAISFIPTLASISLFVSIQALIEVANQNPDNFFSKIGFPSFATSAAPLFGLKIKTRALRR